MRVWLNDLQVCSEITRAEEITEHTYFITDVQYYGIKESLANNGYVWVDGQTVKYSGIKPSNEHVFNQETKEWELDEELHQKELERKRNEIWDKIKELRTEKNSLGFFVNSVNKWFHSDQPAINNYQVIGISILLKTYKPQLWKTMDGSWIEMTEDLFSQVMMAMEEHGKFNFEVAEHHYQNLKQSEEPELYNYQTGWKKNYVDLGG